MLMHNVTKSAYDADLSALRKEINNLNIQYWLRIFSCCKRNKHEASLANAIYVCDCVIDKWL